jgi:hypothetical protein
MIRRPMGGGIAIAAIRSPHDARRDTRYELRRPPWAAGGFSASSGGRRGGFDDARVVGLRDQGIKGVRYFVGVCLGSGWWVAVRVAGRLRLQLGRPSMRRASDDGSFCFRRGMSAIGVKRAGRRRI